MMPPRLELGRPPGGPVGLGRALGGLVRLGRPLNGLIAASAVTVGAWVGRRPVAWGPAALGAAAALLAVASANALNDIVDRRADAVNRPDRPVASGAVGAGVALAFAAACALAAIGLGFAIGPAAGALAASWVVLSSLYSVALKGRPVAGNALVALLAASPLVMGGLTQRAAGRLALPFVLAALAHFAREVVKDVEDVDGDRAAGERTTAVALGRAAALGIARVGVVALAGAAFVPFASGLFGAAYAWSVVAIDALLVVVLGLTGPRAGAARLARASALLKVAMVLGLVAFVLGAA